MITILNKLSYHTNFFEVNNGSNREVKKAPVLIIARVTDTFEATKTENVTGSVSETYQSGQTIAVTGDISESASGNSTKESGGSMTQTSGGVHTIDGTSISIG